MKSNLVLEKSFAFAVRIVRVYQWLSQEKQEYVLSKQLLRSGTSIGANVNEAQAGQSRADFIAKLSIASKEARESLYWINLLTATGYLPEDEPGVISLTVEAQELVRLLTSIVKTTKGG